MAPIVAPLSAPLLGWLMGTLIPIEPDHLCSLIALNAGVRKPWPAFVGGMTWGVGHSVGMLLFCVVFLPLESLVHVNVWEYYGNYVAGALLICIGVFFLVSEWKYLETTDDGTCMPKLDGCCACGHSAYGSITHARGHHTHTGHCSPDCSSDPESEQAPLLPTGPVVVLDYQDKMQTGEESKVAPTRHWDDFKRAVIGMLQGLCCPSCIAGLAFVGQMGAQQHTGVDVAFFFAVCFMSIVLCSGLVSAGCVLLGGYFGGYFSLSTRTLYRSACFFSVAAGIIWIVLNYFGQLHVIDYTHDLEHKLMAKGGKDGKAMMEMMAGMS